MSGGNGGNGGTGRHQLVAVLPAPAGPSGTTGKRLAWRHRGAATAATWRQRRKLPSLRLTWGDRVIAAVRAVRAVNGGARNGGTNGDHMTAATCV